VIRACFRWRTPPLLLRLTPRPAAHERLDQLRCRRKTVFLVEMRQFVSAVPGQSRSSIPQSWSDIQTVVSVFDNHMRNTIYATLRPTRIYLYICFGSRMAQSFVRSLGRSPSGFWRDRCSRQQGRAVSAYTPFGDRRHQSQAAVQLHESGLDRHRVITTVDDDLRPCNKRPGVACHQEGGADSSRASPKRLIGVWPMMLATRSGVSTARFCSAGKKPGTARSHGRVSAPIRGLGSWSDSARRPSSTNR